MSKTAYVCELKISVQCCDAQHLTWPEGKLPSAGSHSALLDEALQRQGVQDN